MSVLHISLPLNNFDIIKWLKIIKVSASIKVYVTTCGSIILIFKKWSGFYNMLHVSLILRHIKTCTFKALHQTRTYLKMANSFRFILLPCPTEIGRTLDNDCWLPIQLHFKFHCRSLSRFDNCAFDCKSLGFDTSVPIGRYTKEELRNNEKTLQYFWSMVGQP